MSPTRPERWISGKFAFEYLRWALCLADLSRSCRYDIVDARTRFMRGSETIALEWTTLGGAKCRCFCICFEGYVHVLSACTHHYT
jgi:hypothetical protein